MIMSLDSTLRERIKTLETNRQTTVTDDVRSRLLHLEDNQTYLVQRIQDIKSVKNDIIRQLKEDGINVQNGKAPINTDDSDKQIDESECKEA